MATNNAANYSPTQHDVLIGGANGAITNVAPSSTSGVPLISNGSSADPSFGTVVAAGGGTGRTTLTAGTVLSGNGTGNVLLSNTGSAGQVFVAQSSSTSGQYITPTAGTGLSITTNASTLQYALSTPVSVANGGTGDASFTTYAVVCGGTTTTGALQSIASVGTTGQVLTSNGAGALPTFQAASGGGNLVIIQSQTVSSVSSVTFTSGITSSYNNYLLMITNMVIGTTSVVSMQISTNGGSSYISTGYVAALYQLQNTNSLTNDNSTTIIPITNGNSSTISQDAVLWLKNFTGGTGYINVVGQSYYANGSASSAFLGGLVYGTYNTSSTTANAFKISPGSGTFSGTFTLFGLTE